jgi:hypothetical protein
MQRWHEAITIEHLLDYSTDLESIVYSHPEDTGSRWRTVSAGTKQRNVAGQAALLEEVLRLFCLRIRGYSDIFILILTIRGVILVESRLVTPTGFYLVLVVSLSTQSLPSSLSGGPDGRKIEKAIIRSSTA